MAIGKNKRVNKAGRKGSKKKVVDAFSRKEHYIVKAPSYFNCPNIGNTMVSKSHGLKKSEDSLKGRVFDINMADLQKDEAQGNRKVQLICEDVQGRSVLTDFHGMSVTRDYLCSQVKKYHSLIEAFVDIKTVDGYQLRMFAIAFTKEVPGQKKVNCYAKSSHKRAIRQRMLKVIQEESLKCTLKELVKKIIPEAIGKRIEKLCKPIFPLQNVAIYKVKVVKRPKIDLAKLMEIHTVTDLTNTGAGEHDDAKNLLTTEIEA